VAHVDSPREVGRRLRQARDQAGLSQRQLAFPGCSPAYLSRIEAGERTPSLQLLRELARRLNVSEEFLAYGTERTSTSDSLFEAELALRMDEHERAKELYGAVLEEEDPHRRAPALEGLGQLAFREGDLHEAINLLEQAQVLYGKGADERRALIDTLARAHAWVGELEAAIALYERGIRSAEEREDLLDTTRLSVALAAVLSDAGRLGEAEQLLARALVHADELVDPLARVRLYWAQCRLHIIKERPDLAERYGRKVIELLELTEDSYNLGRAYRLMASIELDRQRPAEALELLGRARSSVGETGNEGEEAAIRLWEARALAQVGELEQAAGIAMEVAGVLSERPEEAGQSYTLLARTFAEAGERAKAIELLELACELLEKTPNRFLVEAYAELADLLESEGRRDEAYEVMRKAVRARTASTRSAPPRQ